MRRHYLEKSLAYKALLTNLYESPSMQLKVCSLSLCGVGLSAIVSFYGLYRITLVGGNHVVYERLSLDRREIRLCTLQPATKCQPLSCALSVVSLESRPEYETLSYVWGDSNLSNEIIANGSVIRITNNLHTALRYLRSPDVPRVIWADGICINQLDLDERSCQVRIMDDIYRRASGVQIWLGEAEDIVGDTEHSAELDLWIPEDTVKSFTEFLQSDPLLSTLPPLAPGGDATLEANIPGAFRIMELLAAGHHFYQMPFFKVTSLGAIEPCPVWFLSMRSLAVILSRPWWTRVWTIQEAMLSAQAIVHIGHYQAPLSLFLGLYHSIAKHDRGCCSAAQLLWYGNADTIRFMSRTNARLGHFLSFNDDGLNGRITLTRALLVASTRKASDPRDYVYGLHGVLYSKDRLIKPNYDLSIDKVFTNATRVIFEEAGSISALAYAVGVGPDNSHKLPSWVCDWTLQTDWIIQGQFYKASHGEPFITKQTKERMLTIEAYKVDLISTFKNPTGVSIFERGGLKEDVKCVEGWLSAVDIKNSDDRCAFWTTVLFGLVSLEAGDRRILPKDLTIIETWWELAQSADKEGRGGSFLNGRNRDLIRVAGLIRNSVRAYKFWLTSQGFLGMGPQTLEKGDEVLVVKGSRLPLILRPIENTIAQNLGISGQERGYFFVGQCYLHGFMDGEAVKPDTEWETVHLC